MFRAIAILALFVVVVVLLWPLLTASARTSGNKFTKFAKEMDAATRDPPPPKENVDAVKKPE